MQVICYFISNYQVFTITCSVHLLTDKPRVDRVHPHEGLVVLRVFFIGVVVVGRGGRRGGRGRGRVGRGRRRRHVVDGRHVAQRLADGHVRHRQHVAVGQRADVRQPVRAGRI